MRGMNFGQAGLRSEPSQRHTGIPEQLVPAGVRRQSVQWQRPPSTYVHQASLGEHGCSTAAAWVAGHCTAGKGVQVLLWVLHVREDPPEGVPRHTLKA
jgi:hypothetical protein